MAKTKAQLVEELNDLSRRYQQLVEHNLELRSKADDWHDLCKTYFQMWKEADGRSNAASAPETDPATASLH